MNLNVQAIEPMTFEELMHAVYRESADTQLRALNAPDGATVHFSITFTIEVPARTARAALDSFEGPKIVEQTNEEKRLAQAQRAFKQNPTPALSTIIKRLARLVARQRQKKP